MNMQSIYDSYYNYNYNTFKKFVENNETDKIKYFLSYNILYK